MRRHEIVEKRNSRQVKARNLKVGMIVEYDGDNKVTDVEDNGDGTFTIGFGDDGTEFDANDSFTVR